MRLVSAVLVAGLAAAACTKSDAPKASGQSASAQEPAAKGAPAAGGVIGGPRGAALEGAAPADQAPGAPDDSFQVETAAVAGAAGGESVARVVVTPGKGFHMNKDYPTKLTLELPSGVTSPKAILEPADAEAFTENQLAFAVKLTAAAKGDYTIPGTLKFAVCTESTCNPKKQAIALSLKTE